MKDKFENIEEVFNQAFDGFEADVDPSVWSSVSNAINSGGTSSATTATLNTVKSSLFKIAASVIAVGSIATATYLLTKEGVVKVDKIVQQEELSENLSKDNETVVVKVEKPNKAELVKEEVVEDEFVNKENENNHSVVTDEEQISENKEEEYAAVQNNPDVEQEASVSPQNKEQTSNPVVKSNANDLKQETQNTPSILEPFDVEIVASIIEGFAPLDVDLNLSSNVVSASWDFKDGETSNQKNIFHTFYKAGKYLVTVKVLDENNRTKKITKTIIVKSNFPSSLDPIQRIITPNGDFNNDEFKIRGENIEKLEVFILDRNGKLIKSLRTVDAVWDGTDQSGTMVVDGMYIVSGVVVGFDGEKHRIKSTINVFK